MISIVTDQQSDSRVTDELLSSVSQIIIRSGTYRYYTCTTYCSWFPKRLPSPVTYFAAILGWYARTKLRPCGNSTRSRRTLASRLQTCATNVLQNRAQRDTTGKSSARNCGTSRSRIARPSELLLHPWGSHTRP